MKETKTNGISKQQCMVWNFQFIISQEQFQYIEMGDTWLGNAGNVMQYTSQLLVSQETFSISWEDIVITIGE